MCFNHRLRLKQIFAHVTHTRTHTHTGKNADLCALGQSWSTLDRKWRPTCCQMPIQSVCPLANSLCLALSLSLSASLVAHKCNLYNWLWLSPTTPGNAARLGSPRLVAAREALSIWIYVGICLNNLYSAGGLSCCCCHSCRTPVVVVVVAFAVLVRFLVADSFGPGSSLSLSLSSFGICLWLNAIKKRFTSLETSEPTVYAKERVRERARGH